MFDDTYLTLAQNGEGIFKDRGSRFIGYAFPVRSEQEIKDILAGLRKEHHGANHHCYAWRLGADKQSWRANDDGEPSNSAGKPILGQLQSHDLTDSLVVVVRYFGGTLLGVSGLINAYRSAAAEAIKHAGIAEKHIHLRYGAMFPFETMNEVMRLMKQFNCHISRQEFETECRLEFSVRRSLGAQLEAKLTSIPSLKLTYS